MASEDRERRYNRESSQRKSSSERERIKNITYEIHPEYETTENRSSKSSQNTTGKKKNVAQTGRKRSVDSEEAYMTNRQARAEALRRQRKIRTKRARRKRRIRRFLRILAFCLIVVVVAMTVYVVGNYNTGARHDNKGLTAYENGDYETAIAEFKEAISYDSSNAEYYIHLGMTYIQQKAYDEALGYFNQAEVCAESEEQKALIGRGRGIACLYEGEYANAVAWFEQVLDSLEMSTSLRTDILYYKAEAEEKLGDYATAVASYSEIIDLNNDAGALMLRGLAYVSLEDYASAETDLYAAIAQSRKSYAIYRALYSALIAQGKDTEATQVLNDALELSGSSGEDYFNRGMIYIDLQDYTQAEEMFNTSYGKGYTSALLGLGEVAVCQEAYESALTYYEKFFAQTDLTGIDGALAARAYNQYAVTLLALEDYEMAATACEAGLKYNNRDADAALTFNLIIAYEYLGRWEEAYSMAKSYVEKYPEDADGLKEYTFLCSRIS